MQSKDTQFEVRPPCRRLVRLEQLSYSRDVRGQRLVHLLGRGLLRAATRKRTVWGIQRLAEGHHEFCRVG